MKRGTMFETTRANGVLRIFNHLLRISTLIIIGCPTMNNGLSSIHSDSTFINGKDIYQILPRTNMERKSNNLLTHEKENFVTETDDMQDIYNYTPMYFGTVNSTVVATQIGATAHLPCIIHHIGDGVVSWIRRKDYHLLTVGLTTYSSDERYSATHLIHSEDWTLQIKFVQLRDAGMYEWYEIEYKYQTCSLILCSYAPFSQVSTHPIQSIFLHLNVVEAKAEIIGPSIRYLTPGSTLKLMCRITQNTESSAFIFWYNDNRMINYDFDRGINVSTESDYHYSELTIHRTRKEHSGNYTCVPSNAQPASVLVQIFKGDNPAAMYHDHRGSSDKSYQNNILIITALLATLVYSLNGFCIKRI